LVGQMTGYAREAVSEKFQLVYRKVLAKQFDRWAVGANKA